MDKQLIISFLELSIAVVIGILSLYITHFVVVRIYKSKFPTDNPYKNNAFLIFMTGMMFSVAYLLSGIIHPLSSTRDLLTKSYYIFGIILDQGCGALVFRILFCFLCHLIQS